MYLSSAFSTSTPTIHWSHTIRCHISFTASADVDNDLTGVLASCMATNNREEKDELIKSEQLFVTIILIDVQSIL